jgi:hypothetical protein
MLIGYEGYSKGNSGIADRRRILYWAAARGHSIVNSRDKNAEVVVITSSSDLGYWARAKQSKPLILDVVDGLVGEQNQLKNSLRGLGYWGTGRSSSLLPKNYRSLLLSVARRCDKVICSSPEQVYEWSKFQVKAIDILDVHEEIPRVKKPTGIQNSQSNDLFWEGLPATLSSVSLLNDFFKTNQDWTLNILTNLNSYRYMNKYRRVDLGKLLARQLDLTDIRINLLQWSPEELLKSSERSTAGVIPILGSRGYNHLKAENRLLIMWRLGLPVLTSPLMSYSRVMKEAQIDGICQDSSDWKAKLGHLLNSADLREEFTQKSRYYLEKKHKTEDLLEKWDYVFGKI